MLGAGRGGGAQREQRFELCRERGAQRRYERIRFHQEIYLLTSTIARRIAGQLPIFSCAWSQRLGTEHFFRDRRRRSSRRVAGHAGPQSVSNPWARPVLESTSKLCLRRDGQPKAGVLVPGHHKSCGLRTTVTEHSVARCHRPGRRQGHMAADDHGAWPRRKGSEQNRRVTCLTRTRSAPPAEYLDGWRRDSPAQRRTPRAAGPGRPARATHLPDPGPGSRTRRVRARGHSHGRRRWRPGGPGLLAPCDPVTPALRRGRSSRVPFRGNANFLARAPVLYHD